MTAVSLSSDPSCERIGARGQALSVVDRAIVGRPGEDAVEARLDASEASLRCSRELQRAHAWRTAQWVLEQTPVALAAELPLASPTLPRFQTWYGRDDLTRVFRRLYSELDAEARSARDPFEPQAIDAAFDWNANALSDFPAWTDQRLSEYLAGFDEPSAAHGLGGLSRVTYSPSASRHLLDSYAQVLSCRERRASPQGDATCQSDQSDPRCLDGPFPRSSVIVKASFHRADLGRPVPVYDTSASALARRLSSPSPSYDEPDGWASPDAGEIYSLRLPNGNEYYLTGLHVMTKQLDEWFWLTLWWSDDPDSGFGADRPGSLPAPFDHYEMCSVTTFREPAADPSHAGASEDSSPPPTLPGTALAAGGPSWCSNPYLERDPDAVATNCMGCHQHAGSGLSSSEILGDEQARPQNGRLRARCASDNDYVFALDVGEDLGATFAETERHHAP